MVPGKIPGNPATLIAEILEQFGGGGPLDPGTWIPEGGPQKTGPSGGLKMGNTFKGGFADIRFRIKEELKGKSGLILPGEGACEVERFQADIHEGIFGQGKKGCGSDQGRAGGRKMKGLLPYLWSVISKEIEEALGRRRLTESAEPDCRGPGAGGGVIGLEKGGGQDATAFGREGADGIEKTEQEPAIDLLLHKG